MFSKNKKRRVVIEGLSKDGKDFLRKCFAIDPSER